MKRYHILLFLLILLAPACLPAAEPVAIATSAEEVIARCGLSGEWLGPPNFHGYQTALRRVHRERYANMPFERYMANVRTERGEEALNAWLATQTTHTRFRRIGGGDDEWMTDRGEVERHFVKYLFGEAFEESRRAELPGNVAARVHLARVLAWQGRSAEAIAMGVLILMALWAAGVTPGSPFGALRVEADARLERTYEPESYSFDGDTFINAVLLMKTGRGFYDAYGKAIADSKPYGPGPMAGRFNVREPYLFYLWRVLPGQSRAPRQLGTRPLVKARRRPRPRGVQKGRL